MLEESFDMQERMRRYIDGLFINEPGHARLLELKEELFSHMWEHYLDLRQSGRAEEDAYREVQKSVGDVSELKQTLQTSSGACDSPQAPPEPQRYESAPLEHKGKSYRQMASSLVLPVYFILSFVTGAWQYTWLIFLCTPVLYAIIGIWEDRAARKSDEDTVLDYRGNAPRVIRPSPDEIRKDKWKTLLFALIPFVYLAISLFTGQWALTWVIFLCYPLVARL